MSTTDTPMRADRRILKSRQVHFGWRANPPAGPAHETLRMIQEEIVELNRLAALYPEKAAKIGMLVRNWNAMAVALVLRGG